MSSLNWDTCAREPGDRIGCDRPTTSDAADIPAVPHSMLLILPLGASNDAAGKLDAAYGPRVVRVLDRYKACVAAGRPCRVLPSGGIQANFNPTQTPHWEYVAAALIDAGLPESVLLRPGLPALHTVDEAIMARSFVLDNQAAMGIQEVLVITSDFHAARARHLFGVAFGAHAACPVEARVEETPGAIAGEARTQRVEHEKKSLRMLRNEPFGAWQAFVQKHGLAATNKSLRWSRRLAPSSDDAAQHAIIVPQQQAAAGAGIGLAVAHHSRPVPAAAAACATNADANGDGALVRQMDAMDVS